MGVKKWPATSESEPSAMTLENKGPAVAGRAFCWMVVAVGIEPTTPAV